MGLVERYLAELARIGGHGETGVWRTAYSPEGRAASERRTTVGRLLTVGVVTGGSLGLAHWPDQLSRRSRRR